MEHPGVACDKCKKTIEGFRYKCIECNNFDLCKSCELDYHLGHVIMRFTDQITPNDKEFLKKIASRRPRYKPFLIQGFHDDVKCHSCGIEYVDGFLYKCCDCTYNACRRCEKQVYECFTGKAHSLFRFADPLSLNSFNKRFWLEIVEIRSTMRYQNVSERDFQPKLSSGPVIHEGTKCKVCESEVVGLRFKCIDCREYDLCSSCEPKNTHVGHLLVRVGILLDSEIKMIFEQIVRLRLSINKRSSTRAAQVSNPSIRTRNVTCATCKNVIHSYRYKCLQCVNIDFCSFCQLKECHTEHLMVRFTEPLTQNLTNHRFFEAIRRSKFNADRTVSMPNWSRTMNRTNVMGRYRDYDTANNRFISNINQNNFGKAIQNCSVCFAIPSEIILLNCGHLCVCSNCIDGYLRLSQQCPICRLAITSTHRAYY